MLKQLLKISLLIVLIMAFSLVRAESIIVVDNQKIQLMSAQIELLKNRYLQAKNQLQTLQDQQVAAISNEQMSKDLLNQLAFDISLAKSNLNSINIELAESQQTIHNLGKNIQELHNQINIVHIFGPKNSHNQMMNPAELRENISYQKELLNLEKKRASYLLKLQKMADNTIRLKMARYAQINTLLKAQNLTEMKNKEVKAEATLQQQQAVWLKRSAALQMQLNQTAHNLDERNRLQAEIFFVNQHVDFTYLQMLITRYMQQLQQLKISSLHSNSITLLNQIADQAQSLTKQLNRMNALLNDRMNILIKRNDLFVAVNQADNNELAGLIEQYKMAVTQVERITQEVTSFRATLDQLLKQELSSRQGLPSFGSKAWLDVGGELLLVPSLTFQMMKNLSFSVMRAFHQTSLWGLIFLLVLEVLWVFLLFGVHQYFKRIIAVIPDHEFGHLNLKWLSIKLIDRTMIDCAVILNLLGLFYYLNLPSASFYFLIELALVWLIFKVILVLARLYLLETVTHREGRDVRLYYQLKWIFLAGGLITMLTVLVYQLPFIYEVKDLFARLFLFFLLIASLFLLKEWELVPGLILPYIDERRTYFKRVVRLLGMLVPLVILINAAIGLFGYVNLILTISWYESIFLLVFVAYLLARGVVNEALNRVSSLLIRHVSNGWLWTEAFLKPIDHVLRIILFLFAWTILFLLYGWDQQSPVVERLDNLLHYPVVQMLNTTITPLSIIELAIVISLFYWAVRWTREFVYRLLLSRTKDLGLRNSIAILSQYAMIVIGLFICLRLLGIDLKALTFVATAFAFGVGLGLRDLVNNFACGFLLLIERPIKVGDTVSINGYEGDVTHIGGRAVTIQTFDHMDVIVPNAEIFSKSFVNWTGKDNVVRTVINIKMNWHDNPQAIQNIIYQVLNNNKDVLKDPPPEVFLKELTEGLREFEIRYYLNLRQVKSRLGLRSEVLMAITDAFEKNGITPPYPHHEILMKN